MNYANLLQHAFRWPTRGYNRARLCLIAPDAFYIVAFTTQNACDPLRKMD